MKKGFIMLDAVLCLFISGIIINIVFSIYFLEKNYLNAYEKSIEEIRWEKENILNGLNSCVIKKDLVQQP